MSPADLENQATNFVVFKRRKNDPKTATNSDSNTDPQVINIQEESSEEKDSQEKSTMVLTNVPTIPFTYVEETIESPISSTS